MNPPPTSQSGEGDFSYDELQYLEQRGLLIPSTTSGKRILSTEALSLPILPLSHAGNTFTITLRTRDIDPGPTRYFEVPTALVSGEALEFIGLTHSVAHEIFQCYQDWCDPAQDPSTLMDYVHGHISTLKSRHNEDSAPREAMDRIGLTREAQDVLMDPKYSQMFGTESLHDWVEETLRFNYISLRLLHQRLKNQARPMGNFAQIPSLVRHTD